MICPNCFKEMGSISHGHCQYCRKHCGCSFNPISDHDYCEFHRRIEKRIDVFMNKILGVKSSEVFAVVTLKEVLKKWDDFNAGRIGHEEQRKVAEPRSS